ncbi:hypothetical protein RB195_007590 [Necator americanus]
MNADTMDEEHEEEHQHTVGNDQETDSMEQSELNPEQEIQTKQPEMDEDDIAEMSMIAAQIESAEDFNLTFEAVDTSELHEEEISKGKGKRRRSKDVSPLYVSDREEIEEFLEEGINDSVVGRESEHISSRAPSERMGQPKGGSETIEDTLPSACGDEVGKGQRIPQYSQESSAVEGPGTAFIQQQKTLI